MQRLADIALISASQRRFVAYAEGCFLCHGLTNELFTVEIAGSEISVLVCREHPDPEIIDEIVWCLAQRLRKLGN